MTGKSQRKEVLFVLFTILLPFVLSITSLNPAQYILIESKDNEVKSAPLKFTESQDEMPSLKWAREWGSVPMRWDSNNFPVGNILSTDIAFGIDGSVFVIGEQYFLTDDSSPFIVKYSSNGVIEWESYLDGTDLELADNWGRFISIVVDTLGNSYVTLIDSQLLGDYIIKFDVYGELEWYTTIDDWHLDQSILKIGDDGFLYCATTGISILKLNIGSGELISNITCGGNHLSDWAIDSWGNYYTIVSSDGIADRTLIKQSQTGGFIWNLTDRNYYHIGLDSIDSIYTTVRSAEYGSSSDFTTYLMKYNSDGQYVNEVQCEFSDDSIPAGIVVDAYDNPCVIGLNSFHRYFASSSFLAYYNPELEMIWHTILGPTEGPAYDWTMSIAADLVGNVAVVSQVYELVNDNHITIRVVGYPSATNEPPITPESLGDPTTYYPLLPEWSLSASSSWSGNLGADFGGFGFYLTPTLSYEFDAGIELPVELGIYHPEYIEPGSDTILNFSVTGADSARAWAYLTGSFSADLVVGIFNFELDSESLTVGDEITFTTPMGRRQSNSIIAEGIIASQVIDLIVVSYTVDVVLSVTLTIEVDTYLSTHLDITGDTLLDNIDKNLTWYDSNHIESAEIQVNNSTGEIDLDFSSLKMTLDRLYFGIQSIDIKLRIDGSQIAQVNLNVPELGFVIADDTSPLKEGFQTLGDLSGTSKIFDDISLSIIIGRPLFPANASPLYFLLIVPAIMGIAFGKKSKKGSFIVAIALLGLTIVMTAFLYGFILSEPFSIIITTQDLSNLLIPEAVSFDPLGFLFGNLHWILIGLTVGAASKSYKKGILLSILIAPFLYLLPFIMTENIGNILIASNQFTNIVVAIATFITVLFAVIGTAIVGHKVEEHSFVP